MYKGIDDFKKGYQPRTNRVKDEKGDLVVDPFSAVDRRRNSFSQVLNVQLVKNMIKSQQNYLGQGVEQFIMRSINLFFLFGKMWNCPRNGGSRSLYLSIRRGIKQTVVIIVSYHFCQLRIKFYPTSCCQG